MKEMVEFFKEVFMLKQNDKICVGLSQFKYSQEPVTVKEKQVVKKAEVKLSDLMRRS